MYYDFQSLLLVAPAMLLALWAQWRVQRAMSRWSKVGSSTGMTGAEVARRILETHGVDSVRIEESHGFLSDHYDPAKRVLRLSPDVFRGRSVAAAGVAAHECGHALQHRAAYRWLMLRQTMVPAALAGSNLSWILILLGFFLEYTGLLWLGIGLFSLAVVFSIVTLPVEFDATRRAKAVLPQLGLVSPDDSAGVSAVLDAAAMTYVAAAAVAVLELVSLVLRASSRD